MRTCMVHVGHAAVVHYWAPHVHIMLPASFRKVATAQGATSGHQYCIQNSRLLGITQTYITPALTSKRTGSRSASDVSHARACCLRSFAIGET